jgi:hypothetical protein
LPFHERLAGASCSPWINGVKHTTAEVMTAISGERRRAIMLSRKKIDRGVRLRNVCVRKLVTSLDLTTVGADSARLPPMPRLRRLSRAVEGCVRFDNDKCLFP